MSLNYSSVVSKKVTPQTEQADPAQVPNSAGGFSFEIDAWKRLERFIVLGSEGGTYYIGERKLTKDNAENVVKLIKEDGARVVNTVVEISDGGRAPKNDAAIFALALAVTSGSPETKKQALAALPRVCRIGTHLFQFVEAIENLGGWGKTLTRAISDWYTKMDADKLALQLVKYQQRNGWSHRDVFRKAHIRHAEKTSASHQAMFRWVVDRENLDKERQIVRYKKSGDPVTVVYPPVKRQDLPEIIDGFEQALLLKEPSQCLDLAALIRKHSLPRECVPTEALGSAFVWEALLENMPMTAMIRNLGKMTSVGILNVLNDGEKKVIEMLGSKEALKKARVHPLNLLIAQKIYAQGHGDKGSLAWTPNQRIVDALDAAFYDSFDVVVPTGKRHYLGIDVSGSMGTKMDNGPLSCREAAAAMAMVIARTEKQSVMFGFCHKLVELPISPRMRLDAVVDIVAKSDFGSTDCAQPMLHALANNIPVDAFLVLTDSETFQGNIHAHQALKQYRQKTGIAAKEVVLGMVSTSFTIADPDDAGMLDCVGFDTTVPAVIADFVRG
jgi:60 kDa SS-A/Ro ribonucleoprotein